MSKNQKSFNLKDVLELYQSDERLLRFLPILERELICNPKACLNELTTEHLMEAYWLDIGGEA